MDTLVLGTTGRRTSRLGFGCSSLLSAGGRVRGLRLLETAYAAGVRHFDTAPMYGEGESEEVLGDFLERHREDCTVTTKFGIPPRKAGTLIKLARHALRPVFANLPGLKRRLQGAVSSRTAADSAGPAPNPIFNAGAAQLSLETSLRKLKVDRVDLFLLHEVRAQDLAASGAEGLLRLMQDAQAAGKVGMFGVGSDRRDLPDLEEGFPAFTQVTQSEWSILSHLVPDAGNVFRLHHRALSGQFPAVMECLRRDPAVCRTWSEEVGADLRNDATVARLMLKAACVMNPAGVVLFSSRSMEHVRASAAVVAEETLAGPAERLYRLSQREFVARVDPKAPEAHHSSLCVASGGERSRA